MPKKLKQVFIPKGYGKSLFFALLISCSILLSSCSKDKYIRFQSEFSDVFDTYTVIAGYAENEEEFNRYIETVYRSMVEYDGYFNIYNDFYDSSGEKINNLKTINDMAGISPVEVSKEIIDFLNFCKQAYDSTDGKVNIALGSVLSIWHDYREKGNADMMNAELPPVEALKQASEHTDINMLIINTDNSTVFLADPGMSIDVGALAKGYAAQIAVDKAKAAGMYSGLFNFGGNVIAVGKPYDGKRQKWSVGIQDPALDTGNSANIKDTVFIDGGAVVASGSYQRYYIVGGEKYHHIIDPETLMPAVLYNSVTVVAKDSAIADMLSTAIFILPKDKGRALAEEFSAEVIWIDNEGSIDTTDGYKKISKELSGYSSADTNSNAGK